MRCCLSNLDGYAQRTVSWVDSERKLWNFAVRNVLQDAIQEEGLTYAVLQMREGNGRFSSVRPGTRGGDDFGDGVLGPRYSTGGAGACQNDRKPSPGIRVPVPMGRALPHLQTAAASAVWASEDEQRLSVDEGSMARQVASVSEWHLVEEIVSGMKQTDKRNVEQGLHSLQTSLSYMSEQSIMRSRSSCIMSSSICCVRCGNWNSPGAAGGVMWNKLQHSLSVKDLMNVITDLVRQIRRNTP